MPLVRSFTLSKKKGKEAYIEPDFADGNFTYHVKQGKHKESGTVNRTGARCEACGASVGFDYIRNEGKEKRIGNQLMAIVAEGKNGRVYLSPNEEHIRIARVEEPLGAPDANLPEKALGFRVQLYGMTKHKNLFTNRQLTALTTLSALVGEAQKQAEADAMLADFPDDSLSLADGGKGARAYSEGISVYLSFALDRILTFSSTISRWSNTNEKIMSCYARQALPMVWDFAEANNLAECVGGFMPSVSFIAECINTLNFPGKTPGIAIQFDAQSNCRLQNVMISTDPPYYDNIGYADLSDFFYIWMRQALKHIYPGLFRTMLVPKAEELIATPYRHDGDMSKAKEFFEDGMYQVCCRLHQYACEDIPVTIYYAFKQSENDEEKTASSGWETMLSAIIRAGFAITGTWPIRTEQSTRVLGNGTNALASSIVLVCRKRAEGARDVSRREFINALHREMRPALEKLQSANIAPVDLAQSAIGPGIAVFSRYRRVLEANGEPMSVRAALQIINQELDAFYNAQEGELDRESRFCVELFSQSAFNTLAFGDADILARAKNTSVQALAERGVLQAAKGKVRLLPREEIPEKVNPGETCVWLLTQQLARAMEVGGVKQCAQIVMHLFGSNAENAKALAYRLYTICERKGWAAEGYAYNNLVVAWPDIQATAANLAAAEPVQLTLADVIGGAEE